MEDSVQESEVCMVDSTQELEVSVEAFSLNSTRQQTFLFNRATFRTPPQIGQVLKLQTNLQTSRKNWGEYTQWGRSLNFHEDEPNITNYSEEERRLRIIEQRRLADIVEGDDKELVKDLNSWLTNCVQPIETRLVSSILKVPVIPIRIAIHTQNPKLQLLPWERCSNFVNHFSDGNRSVNTIVGF